MDFHNLPSRILNRIKSRSLYLVRRNFLYCRTFYSRFRRKYPDRPVKLNLGCNVIYMEDWINVDFDKHFRADLYADLRKIAGFFPEGSVDAILLSHVISYLSHEDALRFFAAVRPMLKDNAPLILEFPDIKKIAGNVLQLDSCGNDAEWEQFVECLRPIFAFVPEQFTHGKKYDTYVFSWSAAQAKYQLEKAGYRKVLVLPPQYHNGLCNRDTRIEAYK